MAYIKVENGIASEMRSKPNWRDANGNSINDDRLFIADGIYPLRENRPSIDPRYQLATPNPMKQWRVHHDHVEMTWTVEYLPLQDAKAAKMIAVEHARLASSAQMPWTVPATRAKVVINVQEDAPTKPRQTWLAGTILWASTEIAAGHPDATDDLIAADDSTHSLTAADWITLGKDIKGWIRRHIEQERIHKRAVDLLTTTPKVMAYDETANWPGLIK